MRPLREYQKLHLKKYRDQFGLFIVEGKRSCDEALQSNWKIEAAYIREDFQSDPDFVKFSEKIKQRGPHPGILKTSQFKKLSDIESPQGILLIMKKPVFAVTLIPEEKILIILDGIRDPGNMGTIIRNADWFGIKTVITSQDSVDIYNPKVIRASMGSIFRVSCIESKNLLQTITDLKTKNFTVIGTSPIAPCAIEDYKPTYPLVIILGGEAAGISSSLIPFIDKHIRITKFGKAESLNVAVAAGILMNYYSRLSRELN